MFFWMEHEARENNIKILHKLNNEKEIRIGPYFVDGYCPETNTVYEFLGDYYHGHICDLTKKIKNKKWRKRQPKLLKRTQDRIKYIEEMGYHVKYIWECQYKKDVEPFISDIRDKYLPKFYQTHKHKVGCRTILNSVKDDSLFGMVELDIRTPERWTGEFKPQLNPEEYFHEMSPVFCTTKVPYNNIGDHMKEHVQHHSLSQEPRKLLVGGTRARKVLLATPLLKWYLEHGMEVTKIHQVIEFTPSACFKPFQDRVSDARREGDKDPNTAIIADTMKLIGEYTKSKYNLKYNFVSLQYLRKVLNNLIFELRF